MDKDTDKQMQGIIGLRDPVLPRYRGGHLAAPESCRPTLQPPTPTRTPPPGPAAPSRPLSPPRASHRRCPPPIRPEPGAASLTYTPGTGARARARPQAHPSQLTFPSETPKVLSQVSGKLRGQFQHRPRPPKSSLLLSPAAHLRCPGTPARPHPRAEDAVEGAVRASGQGTTRGVRPPNAAGGMGRCQATGPQVSVRGGARAIEGRRGKRYVGQGSPGLGGEAAEGGEGAFLAGDAPPETPYLLRKTARARNAKTPPLWSSRSPESPHTSSLVGEKSEILSHRSREPASIFTPPPPCLRSRARSRACPATATAAPPPPLSPRALRLPQSRTLTVCRVRGPSRGLCRKLPQLVANSETLQARARPWQFSLVRPPPNPAPVCPPAKRKKKKKVATPAPKTVVGPQLGAQNAHQVSSKRNSLPLAIDCDSRPPPTLATHRKGRRFPRSSSKFDEQGKSTEIQTFKEIVPSAAETPDPPPARAREKPAGGGWAERAPHRTENAAGISCSSSRSSDRRSGKKQANRKQESPLAPPIGKT
ncbi:putative uncharacterized protein ENSP00000383309 [Muntiacus reevesi]|uniref:putative uncharacterized protein ENSP00000383309 n=1 Tax=Muntiacus reevesi TaxID=9886 RepID=UPI003306D74D